MSEVIAAAVRAEAALGAFDVEAVRRVFPAVTPGLAYLDNAATTQKPEAVIDAVAGHWRGGTANVHRGVYGLAARVSAAYEGARERVARFLGVRAEEVVFLRGTTEAVNLVARTFVRQRLAGGKHGDAVLITEMEHHANIVPWQLLLGETGGRLLVAPVDDRGEVILEEWRRLLGEGVAFAAFPHVSNVLGTVNPVAEMSRLAHAAGVPVLVDGAQAVAHLAVDVSALGCDFYAFSSHKVFGPSGVGALWGRAEHLAGMPPFLGGGDMIRSVSFTGTSFADPPFRFEAGTPAIEATLGLAAALDFLESLDREGLATHEADLTAYTLARLAEVPGLTLIGQARERIGVFSFVLDVAHAHDVATVLDVEGVAVRAGHHCAQPLMARFGVPATARASLALYNTRAEVDRLITGLGRVRELFG
ncbi:MAG TPA: cysteine desulfurase [Thermoanaerobaculia bacterium]|nr:cysteine desulfurase [Thermoanaerobaculia bacterium]